MAKESAGRDTVTVACKLPHGLVIQACAMIDADELVQGGGTRRISKAQRLPDTFVVKGNSFPEQAGPRGPFESGYALTPGCPKDLWDRWLEANKANPFVLNKLVFAHSEDRSAAAEARENEKRLSGFERLDPTKLPGRMTVAERETAS